MYSFSGAEPYMTMCLYKSDKGPLCEAKPCSRLQYYADILHIRVLNVNDCQIIQSIETLCSRARSQIVVSHVEICSANISLT